MVTLDMGEGRESKGGERNLVQALFRLLWHGTLENEKQNVECMLVTGDISNMKKAEMIYISIVLEPLFYRYGNCL